MAEPTFEEYLREREKIEKRMNMERLMEEFKEYLQEREMIEKEMNMKMLFEEFMEDMRRKKMMEKRDMIADGGRVLKQTGGITETRTLPPEYMKLDDAGRDAFVARYNVRDGGMPTGIMRTNKAGVMERDYRDKGGFVPVGIKEKAADVPAMLSKNEFVMTADAVRGAGNGSIEKGAQKMYDTMKKLENRVS